MFTEDNFDDGLDLAVAVGSRQDVPPVDERSTATVNSPCGPIITHDRDEGVVASLRVLSAEDES